MMWLPEDTRCYLDPVTREELNNKADWLYQNFGIVKEGCGGIARHTIGKGISLQLDSEDKEWNDLAEVDFEMWATTPDRCDLAGRRNWYEMQENAIVHRFLRGEFFAREVANPRWGGEPCLQLVDSMQVRTPQETTPEQRIFDGVRVGPHAEPLGYLVKGIGEDLYNEVPANEMIHWYKPLGTNQVRGETEFAQSVTPLVNIHDLVKLTTRTAKLQQALAVVVNRSAPNAGQGAVGKLRQGGSGTKDDFTALERVYGGGSIAYVGEGGEVKLINSSSPSPLVEEFVSSLLMRDACAGWGVSSDFFWGAAKSNGPNLRFNISKADWFFQVLGESLIGRFAARCAYRHLSWRIQNGKIPAPKDPRWASKIGFQTPPRVTVDNARDGQLEISQLAVGIETMRSICDKRGRNYRRHVRQWFREWGEAKQIAIEEGVPEAIKYWREEVANQPTNLPSPSNPSDPTQTPS